MLINLAMGSPLFSNTENWQKILTSKKYIHKEKHQMLKQKSATKCKQLKISCLQQKEKCPKNGLARSIRIRQSKRYHHKNKHIMYDRKSKLINIKTQLMQRLCNLKFLSERR